MHAVFNWFEKLWGEALTIWIAGGWAMWAIAVVALVMLGTGVHIWLRLKEKSYASVPEDVWRYWIDRTARARGRARRDDRLRHRR